MVFANGHPRSAGGGSGARLDRLIAEARSGSDAALDALIEQISEQLWAELGGRRQPRGLGPSRGLSDLIQDTLLRVRQKFDHFESHTFAEFKQWARAVLHRRQQEWIRNHRARNTTEKKEKIWLAIRTRLDSDPAPRTDRRGGRAA